MTAERAVRDYSVAARQQLLRPDYPGFCEKDCEPRNKR
jgi:hypothetical protein